MTSAIRLALPHENFSSEDLTLRRDPLGKPIVQFRSGSESGADVRFNSGLHVSNTHDGDLYIALAASDNRLAGIGIDLVDLSRLRDRSEDYLKKLARRFMSDEEFDRFIAVAERESHERILIRVAAHFSLMEAASKALGTGLKVGLGMGTPHALPMRFVGVRQLEPSVRLSFQGEAMRRAKALGAVQFVAETSYDSLYLASAALLYTQTL